jgi:uncharacterized protein (DUF885 family)
MSFEGSNETERINKFFEYSFNTFLERQPQSMAYLGIAKRQGDLDDVSLSFDRETVELAKKHLKILKNFDRGQLSSLAQLSYDLYEYQLNEELQGVRWRDYRYQVNQMFGIQAQVPGFMMNIHQVKSEEDLKNYISRLSQFKRLFGQVINNLMISETKGVVPPKFVFPKVIADSQNIITGYPFSSARVDSPLWSDFKAKLKELKLSKNKSEAYKKEALEALRASVGPAYSQLLSFLKEQSKRATKDDGAWKFPNGKEYYQYRLKKMTTVDLSAEEIHELGLKNVARIHKNMRKIKKKVGYKGDLKSFFKYVGSKKFLYSNSKKGKKAYLKKATQIIGRMEKKLDQLFITKPKASIRVKAVEKFREKSAGMAFYQKPSLDGARPGTYYVNLYNMKALPKWEAEALAYHEGIPGHHMQLSIAQELKAIPMFQKMAHYTAYIEGWGLYSERLPKEHGFYKDPYSDFGRLSMELVRACRLVVDTGIHHKRWTREQAIKYLDENTPGDHEDNIRQINRYIVMPGQATAYMVGMLKILELRQRAKKALGKKYDLRKFHEVILTNGPVPLKVLEKLVSEYIKKEKSA